MAKQTKMIKIETEENTFEAEPFVTAIFLCNTVHKNNYYFKDGVVSLATSDFEHLEKNNIVRKAD